MRNRHQKVAGEDRYVRRCQRDIFPNSSRTKERCFRNRVTNALRSSGASRAKARCCASNTGDTNVRANSSPVSVRETHCFPVSRGHLDEKIPGLFELEQRRMKSLFGKRPRHTHLFRRQRFFCFMQDIQHPHITVGKPQTDGQPMIQFAILPGYPQERGNSLGRRLSHHAARNSPISYYEYTSDFVLCQPAPFVL